VSAGSELAAAALRTTESAALFARAQAALPGGVSSPVRAFRHVGGTPIFVRSGAGATIEDEDGNRFVDYCMSWGPLALGHAHPAVVRAVADTAARGTTFGTPTRAEVELAELVTALYPAAERVRFVSSGTEAVMSAVRVARGATKRDLIVKFDGCYHGHADYLLVQAGSGLATAGIPDSAGVPAAIAGTTAVLPLADAEAFRALMRARGGEVAAVIIEGIPANSGLLVQTREFVELLRDECTKAGALLILDEVITGFRLGAGGAAARYGVRPDLVTFGKVIGGGLPVGAYGGRADLMSQVAPLGPIYQAGTLSGNPVAMAAGKAALETLRAGGWALLEDRALKLEAALRPVVEAAPGPATLVREGSIFWLVFQAGAPRAWGEVDRSGAKRYARFHRALLERGVYLPPSAFEVFFVSTAHGGGEIEKTARAFGEALRVSAA
jgi:glutamate-1-semialdehyde 2,1-aminomutase